MNSILKGVMLILFVIPFTLNAQTIFLEESLEDGNFTRNPEWVGDTSNFEVAEIKGDSRLQLNAAQAGASYLATHSTVAYGSWEFFLHLDFSTLSGSNNLTVFLLSDIADLSGNVSGYALLAGESGSDDVFRILRYSNGSVVDTVVNGTTNINEGGEFQVKIDRTAEGVWTLSVAEGYGSIPKKEATGLDNHYNSSAFLGFRPEYTATRTDRFYFDDIIITQAPIQLTSIEPISNTELHVKFTNDVDGSTAQLSDFFINGIGNPDGISVQRNRVILRFNTPIPGGDYTLSAREINDRDGNALPADSRLSFSLFDSFTQGDVVINEFMYDEPAGQAEYIELRNMTSKRLNISGWQLGDANPPQPIAADSLILESSAYLLLTADSSALFNRYGNRNYHQMSDFPTLNNSGDQIKIYSKSGILVDSLSYASSWGGENRALERRRATAPSIYRENWGNSPNAFGGTPGLANKIAQDTTPPSILNYNIVSSQSLLLQFSERLKTGTATNASNFGINNLSVSEALFHEPDTVELSLKNPLQNNTDYSLTATGIEDIFGNHIPSESFRFTYYEISQADSGDIFIYEFMYDPPPGATEYIELFNPTGKSIDLKSWTLNDNRGNPSMLTNQQFILPPDSFAVIAPDSTLVESFPGTYLLVMGNRFPSLNNGGDDIVVRRPDGRLIDSLQYRSSWGGEQVSLERRSISVAGTFRENWAAAPHSLGSPGLPNNTNPDNTPPELSELVILNASQIQLIFSEKITNSSALKTENYAISPAIDIQLIASRKDTVTLYLAEKLTSGTSYQVSVRGLHDIFGNEMKPASVVREYLEIAPAEPGDIVINEILYQRAAGKAPEFVELYNRSPKNISLSGWQLADASNQIEIGQPLQLKADEYLFLTDNEELASTASNGYYLPGFPSLNDDEDAVYIRSAPRQTIDSLYYSSIWGGHDGISIERKDPRAASNDPSNWITSKSDGGISPGHKNGSYVPDETPPGVLFSTRLPNDLIEVRFTEFIRLTEGLRFSLNGSELLIEEYESSQGNRILLKAPSGNSQNAKLPTVTIQNIADVKGNVTTSATIPIAQPVTPGSVVINEILYNPLSKPDDNLPDQSEYIELRNTRNYAISLEGFSLHDAPDEDGEIQTLVPVSSTSAYLPVDGHLLVHADEALNFSESQTAEFFALTGLSPGSTIRVDRGSLGLASENDAIYLADSTGATIDSVYFDESWQNPNLVDTRGIALERINPSGPSSDASNWSSSTAEKGGTPGTENSIYQVPKSQPEEVGISFSPNPFSPDDDGREDNLFVNYKLDQPDYLLTVRIFDRYGRLVRELADAKQAGYEGSLQWDGLTDSGHRNRIGIYIVLFEAYNSSNGSDRTFKEVVVLARRF